MRIIFTGGGTGGHLFPIIAVAREIKKISKDPTEMMFVGPKTVGEEILEKDSIIKKTILSGKWRRYFSIMNLVDVFGLMIGFFQSLFILFSYMPNVVFAKGGFGSVPLVLAAWIFRIPVIIHESDALPGLANRLLSKFSKRIAISFEQAASYFPAKKTALVGNPIRSSISSGSKEEAKKIFQLEEQKQVILVLGGSQGATTINNILFIVAPELLKKYEIIHQCGINHYEQIKKDYRDKLPQGYHLFPFLNEEQMQNALAAADLILSRGGAGSIFEIAASGKPSVIIPMLNSAGNHQTLNAFEYAKTGATLALVQENLTPNFLKDRIFAIMDNLELLSKMSAAAKSFAKPDAAKTIAKEVLNIANIKQN